MFSLEYSNFFGVKIEFLVKELSELLLLPLWEEYEENADETSVCSVVFLQSHKGV